MPAQNDCLRRSATCCQLIRQARGACMRWACTRSKDIQISRKTLYQEEMPVSEQSAWTHEEKDRSKDVLESQKMSSDHSLTIVAKVYCANTFSPITIENVARPSVAQQNWFVLYTMTDKFQVEGVSEKMRKVIFWLTCYHLELSCLWRIKVEISYWEVFIPYKGSCWWDVARRGDNTGSRHW